VNLPQSRGFRQSSAFACSDDGKLPLTFCGHNVVRLCNTLAIMAYSRLSKLKNRLHSSWKWLLSFRTNDWQLDDYPVEIREQQDNGNPPLPAPRFISHRYVAHILNAAITGSGDTPSAAKEKLKESFRTVRNRRLEDGKPLVRPGRSWPVEFASQEQVNEYEALSEDFIHRVLDLDWAWISDESSLWDFHADSDNSRLNAKIMEVYGVDVSDIQSGRLAAIFERIVQSRSEPAQSIGTPHRNGESH
jgi:hypothetical protein